MGWMSWERFRCGVRHSEAETAAISADLYLNQADKLVKHGLVELGYARVHVDDCWQASERDGAGHLQANATRFPEGIAGLAAKLGEKGVGLGLYTDEGTATCGGYPGSKGTEALDAQTMAAWNVSYLKVDGCENDASDYARGYAAFGEALSSEGLVFSCSWPAYLGDDEAAKPYEAMVAAGCSLWRNWKDIQCSWDSLIEVVNHFGDYSKVLSAAAPPGVYNDPDMLLVGNPCVTLGEARLQMAVWSILGAPLIMGNDLTNISQEALDILRNEEVIAVNQAIAVKGWRESPRGASEVWVRELGDGGDLAVALLYKGNKGDDPTLAGFSLSQIGWKHGTTAKVRDLFARRDMGVIETNFVAEVPPHDCRLFRLSKAAPAAASRKLLLR